MYASCSAFTKTRAIQTIKTNQLAELKQETPTFSIPVNQIFIVKQ